MRLARVNFVNIFLLKTLVSPQLTGPAEKAVVTKRLESSHSIIVVCVNANVFHLLRDMLKVEARSDSSQSHSYVQVNSIKEDIIR